MNKAFIPAAFAVFAITTCTPFWHAHAQATASPGICNFSKSSCECSFNAAVDRMTMVPGWRRVGIGGQSQAKAVVAALAKEISEEEKNHRDAAANLMNTKGPLPADVDQVASYQVGNTDGVTFFGKKGCIVTVARVTGLGVQVVNPARYFLAPF